MPEQNHPVRSHSGKPARTLQDAANDGMVLELRCALCRTRVTYLAHDLLRVCGPDHPVLVAPFDCGRCGTSEFIRVRPRVPALEEYGRLPLRRPVGQVWKWKVGLLGE
jgi:hypothetical protein